MALNLHALRAFWYRGRTTRIFTSGPDLNERLTTMYISVAYSRTYGFLKWCEAHQPSSDADKPDGAAPVAITELPRDNHEAIQRAPHQPWLVPGQPRQPLPT